jgi:hypothetical protein
MNGKTFNRVFFMLMYTALAQGDTYLFINRVNAFQVWQQESPPVTGRYNHAVLLRVQVFPHARLACRKNVNIYFQPVKLIGL